MAEALLIVKENANRSWLARILAAKGHRSFLAKDLSAASNLLKASRDLDPDVVIMDKQPASQEEQDLKSALKWRLPYAEWLILLGADQSRPRGFRHLPNPLSDEQMVDTISQAWNKARKARERKRTIDAAL